MKAFELRELFESSSLKCNQNDKSLKETKRDVSIAFSKTENYENKRQIQLTNAMILGNERSVALGMQS